MSITPLTLVPEDGLTLEQRLAASNQRRAANQFLASLVANGAGSFIHSGAMGDAAAAASEKIKQSNAASLIQKIAYQNGQELSKERQQRLAEKLSTSFKPNPQKPKDLRPLREPATSSLFLRPLDPLSLSYSESPEFEGLKEKFIHGSRTASEVKTFFRLGRVQIPGPINNALLGAQFVAISLENPKSSHAENFVCGLAPRFVKRTFDVSAAVMFSGIGAAVATGAWPAAIAAAPRAGACYAVSSQITAPIAKKTEVACRDVFKKLDI